MISVSVPPNLSALRRLSLPPWAWFGALFRLRSAAYSASVRDALNRGLARSEVAVDLRIELGRQGRSFFEARRCTVQLRAITLED